MYAIYEDWRPINIKIYQTQLLNYDTLESWNLCHMYPEVQNIYKNQGCIGHLIGSVNCDDTGHMWRRQNTVMPMFRSADLRHSALVS